MKKRHLVFTFTSFCCLAFSALVFTACDDVPKHSAAKVTQADASAKTAVDTVAMHNP